MANHTYEGDGQPYRRGYDTGCYNTSHIRPGLQVFRRFYSQSIINTFCKALIASLTTKILKIREI